MIIAIAGRKGGVGRTTTAIHLAHFFQEDGPTLLVDKCFRPNQMCLMWGERNKSRRFEVVPAEALSGDLARYRHIIIDTPARPLVDELKAMVEGADLVILPCKPYHIEFDSLLDVPDFFHDRKPDTTYILLTDVPTGNEKDGALARRVLEDAGLPLFDSWIRHAKAFQHAEVASSFVHEVAGDALGRKAWLDYVAVGKEIHRIFARISDGNPVSQISSVGV